MRTPEYAGQFKRDYKREKKGRHGATLESHLGDVLVVLLSDQWLEPRHHDHALVGAWRRVFDTARCRIRGVQLSPVERYVRDVEAGGLFQRIRTSLAVAGLT